MRNQRRVTGVLLDVDGTLVDSVDAHTRAWMAAFEEFGFRVAYERVRGLIGMGADRVLPIAIGVEADSTLGRRIADRRKEIFSEGEAPLLRPTRGAGDLLDRLREAPVKIGIATSAQPDELRVLLAVVDAVDLGATAADASRAPASKPHPGVVEAALQKNGMVASETILVGDTAYDIEAAAGAGVATIALRCGGWRDKDLEGAIAIYDDPADLLAHADTSPLASILAPMSATS